MLKNRVSIGLALPNMKRLFTVFRLLALAHSKEYYGVYVGKLESTDKGISGHVFLANETILQIVNFTHESVKGR